LSTVGFGGGVLKSTVGTAFVDPESGDAVAVDGDPGSAAGKGSGADADAAGSGAATGAGGADALAVGAGAVDAGGDPGTLDADADGLADADGPGGTALLDAAGACAPPGARCSACTPTAANSTTTENAPITLPRPSMRETMASSPARRNSCPNSPRCARRRGNAW
jgi:putative serine protease PepD